MGAPKSNHGRTCLQKVLSLLKNLILLFPFFMLDKGLTKLFESITGRLPALHPWFWRCKVIRKSSDNQVFFMKFFLQPFPQPFPFSATVPIFRNRSHSNILTLSPHGHQTMALPHSRCDKLETDCEATQCINRTTCRSVNTIFLLDDTPTPSSSLAGIIGK